MKKSVGCKERERESDAPEFCASVSVSIERTKPTQRETKQKQRKSQWAMRDFDEEATGGERARARQERGEKAQRSNWRRRKARVAKAKHGARRVG